MRRNWFIVAIVVGVAAIVIAVILARTVGSDDSGPSEETVSWASSVCSDLTTWQSSIQSIASVAAGGLTKESLQKAFDDAGVATDQLVSELKALGPPDLESGDDVKQELDSSVDQLSTQYEELKSSAQDALDASSPTAMLTALGALVPQFQALTGDAQQLVQTLQSEDVAGDSKDELEEAFSEAESCQELQGSQS